MLHTLARVGAERFGDAPAIRSLRSCRWPELTYAQLAVLVDRVAGGLRGLGVRPGDRVAVLSETRVEWTVCGLAIAAAGAVCVPVYPTNSADECAWVLADSGARVVICEDAAQAGKVTAEHVITMDRLDDLMAPGAPVDVHPDDPGPVDLVAPGAPGDLRPDDPGPVHVRPEDLAPVDVRPEDPALIVYTSGTTGRPKGCVTTHANWQYTIDGLRDAIDGGPGDRVYLYLPLAHALAQIIQFDTLERGGTLCFASGDIAKVADELREVRPHFLPSVPRLFEKVYSRVHTLLESASPQDRESFEHAVELGRRARLHGDVDPGFAAADQRWLAMVRDAFGGCVTQAVTGAAPIAPEILEFFHACGVPVLGGWGMTETTAVATLNTMRDHRFGTVGRPFSDMEIVIAADGEVLVRGAAVFAGYHGDPQATDELVRDGWLHTGDLGELDADGYLRITGRKKDLIIPASGKNISPSRIENDLRQSPWIASAVLHGDRRPYLVALLTLDAEELRARGLPDDPEDPKTRALVQEAVDEVNARYSRPERVRAFALLGHDFALETGELTPSLKVRRGVVATKYGHLLDALYTL